MKLHLITIDGPSGTGKGTLAKRLAGRLRWQTLDSGALYRLLAVAAEQRGVATDDEVALADLARSFVAEFSGDKIYLDDQDITDIIRSENIGNQASCIAALPSVRQLLLQWQRLYMEQLQIETPNAGLVAEGRDMGTVVFPEAPLKVFLTASLEVRARRRYKQLKKKGMSANLPHLVEEISARDRRDSSRKVAPLRMAADAWQIDSSDLSIDEVLSQLMHKVEAVFPGSAGK